MSTPLKPRLGEAQGSIGEHLRLARESLGWSLDQVSLKTRIPIRHLETIEIGRGGDLPSGFIGKSFVRQYAEAVGLNGDQALREFVAQTGVDLEVAFQERKVSPYTPESLKRFQLRWWRNAGILAVTVIVLIVLIVVMISRPSTRTAESKAEGVPEDTSGTDRSLLQSAVSTDNSPSITETSSAGSTPLEADPAPRTTPAQAAVAAPVREVPLNTSQLPASPTDPPPTQLQMEQSRLPRSAPSGLNAPANTPAGGLVTPRDYGSPQPSSPARGLPGVEQER